MPHIVKIMKSLVNFRRIQEYIYYVTCEGLTGDDNEGTVDGIHFTDIGFRRYADKLIPVLKPLLEK